MGKSLRVLVVEDSEDDALLLIRELQRGGYEPVFERVATEEAMRSAIAKQTWDIIIADYMLPHFSGLEALRSLQKSGIDLPFIIVSGKISEEIAVEAMKAGAHDYMSKSNLKRFVPAVERELGEAKMRRERRQTEESLKKSEASYRAIFDSANDAIFLHDPKNGKILDVNLKMYEMYSYTYDETLKIDIETISEGKPPYSQKEATEWLRKAFEIGPQLFEWRAKDKYGRLFWVETNLKLAVIGGEERILAIVRDITDRKKAQEELKEAAKTKSAFTSKVSHELRTPLTAMKEGIALVLDGLAGDINEEQKELLGIAKKNVDRLTRLINDVLDFQKLDSGMMKFNLEANDVNQIVNDVYKMMVLPAKNAGLNFLLELDENLPKVKFDSDKITQVLTNLVNNAMKFTEKGNITIKTSKTEDAVQVSVSDTGYGIKKEDMPKLFDSFAQLGNGGQRKTGGTGLGLAISKEIVEQHGGRVWVKSEPGRGSKFMFTIPTGEDLIMKAKELQAAASVAQSV